ncbi:nitronate monooxygenase [Rhizorhabdus dicambivorans]|uniref:Nitronate monooxygenase n=2 Tax=Rhizorhabdus dicambivorans TaxID=1850238 RepID=A0A2A4FXP3_9SPHN|nr:nitronate monooxygenase [Rhizorhabdus dicambivorans]PCE42526.1 nitronate monooxygenase [Rhizorhabdus dicambivorans]
MLATGALSRVPHMDTLQLPVLAAPMFIVSGPELVIAQCRAGVIGSFPALNARPMEVLDDWLAQICEEVSLPGGRRPFAVNQIVHKSNNRLEHDVELCVKYKVPIVITSLGSRRDVNEAITGYGGIVLHDVINDRFAHKAIENGATGLIAVAAGAGGHAGTLSPFALLREIRKWFDGPLVLSGAITHGASILAAQAAGADLAYVGSAFIATEEATAAAGYKQMIVDSSAADILYTNAITGVHGNYLIPSLVRAGFDPANMPVGNPKEMNFQSGGNMEAKAWRDIWGCGQGLGVIDEVKSTASLVQRLVDEYGAAREDLRRSAYANG